MCEVGRPGLKTRQGESTSIDSPTSHDDVGRRGELGVLCDDLL